MIRAIALLVVVAFAVAALSASEHATPNANLPIVRVALKDYPKDHMLFAPCNGPRYAPREKRNIV